MTKVGLTVHRTFHSFRSRNFRLFFAGQAVSVTGTWMQTVAMAWFVLQLTGSGVALGIVTALQFVPILLFGVWGGLIADRFDKRRVLVGTQASSAALALILWVLVVSGSAPLAVMYVFAFLNGVVTAIDTPTRQSFYVEMVGQRDLPNAVSLNSAVMTGTRILGPAIAGVLIATVGVAPVFLSNAVSYLAVIGGLLAMRPDELEAAPRAPRGTGQVREGLRYVWRTVELRRVLLLVSLVFVVSFNFQVLLPLLARSFDGSAGTLGGLFSLMGVGSLIGALLAAARPRHGFRRVAAGTTAFGLASIAVGLAPSLEWTYLLLVPLGFTAIGFMIAANSTLQLNADDEMRGRTMAVYSIVFLGSTPLGSPLAGWAGEHLGAAPALVIGGVFAALAGMVALLVRRRSAGRTEPRRASEEARLVELPDRPARVPA